MWDPQRLTTLWAFTACYRDSFTLLYLVVWKQSSVYVGECFYEILLSCHDVFAGFSCLLTSGLSDQENNYTVFINYVCTTAQPFKSEIILLSVIVVGSSCLGSTECQMFLNFLWLYKQLILKYAVFMLASFMYLKLLQLNHMCII
jgi:predicted DNA-binding transcriptional regulator